MSNKYLYILIVLIGTLAISCTKDANNGEETQSDCFEVTLGMPQCSFDYYGKDMNTSTSETDKISIVRAYLTEKKVNSIGDIRVVYLPSGTIVCLACGVCPQSFSFVVTTDDIGAKKLETLGIFGFSAKKCN